MPDSPLVAPGPPLTSEQITRFSRHLLLPEVGELGQRRLIAARVAVIGAGGLGSPALLYLAAAGVGTLGIVDDDSVELSNLQRQIIHGHPDVGAPKVASAAAAIARLASGTEVIAHRERLTERNARSILEQYDLVLDGSDNFETRYLVADTCAALGVPLVWGSLLRFDAQVTVFWSRPPAASGLPAVQLRDLFPAPPADTVESCSTAGVLGALCGQAGSIMAAEAVKLITGAGEPLLGRVLVIDALSARWSEVPLRPQGTASVPAGTGATVGVPAPSPAVPHREIRPEELQRRLAARRSGADAFLLLDVREPDEHAAGAIAGSVLVPLGELLTERGRGRVDRDAPVIVYCRSGIRAERAAAELAAGGWQEVGVLRGGYDSWSHTSGTARIAASGRDTLDGMLLAHE